MGYNTKTKQNKIVLLLLPDHLPPQIVIKY